MMFHIRSFIIAVAATLLCQCTSPSNKSADVVVSVADQKLGLYRNGELVGSYKISTSKFGIGDKPGSCQTPLGKHQVIAKIGHGLPPGAVLKSRQWNGEVLPPNAPGRDPIVSRILWLDGQENSNRHARDRFIYIHGTTEENRLGAPASYGCVRMAAKDVIRLFEAVPIGATVEITKDKLPHSEYQTTSIVRATMPAMTSPALAKPPTHSANEPAEPIIVKRVPDSDSKHQRLTIPVTG